MSSSISIPTRNSDCLRTPNTMSSSQSSSYYSESPSPSSSASTPSSASKMLQGRRPSLLSSALSKEKTTVINIGDPDGPPRLITYLSSSQGFDWNPEIFLPSYLDCDYVPLENRREPVHEIRLSEEELRNMLPQ